MPVGQPQSRLSAGWEFGYHGYLSQAGVDGAHQHPEGLAGAAPHGAEDLAQEGDEAQPALHVRLLQLVPVGEVPLQDTRTHGRTELAPASVNSHTSTRSDLDLLRVHLSYKL